MFKLDHTKIPVLESFTTQVKSQKLLKSSSNGKIYLSIS
jgi:hypothetical protein